MIIFSSNRIKTNQKNNIYPKELEQDHCNQEKYGKEKTEQMAMSFIQYYYLGLFLLLVIGIFLNLFIHYHQCT